MSAILATRTGRKAVVPDHVDLATVIGLDADGRIVVHEDWMSDHAFGLTLCCNAFDKGREDGVSCRACFGSDEIGSYLFSDGSGGYVGLDEALIITPTHTATPAPKEPAMPQPEPESIPFPAGLDNPEVGMVVEFEQFWLDRPSDKPLLNRPFKVTKINPKSIMVEDENGQVVKTAAYMLKRSDRPFAAATEPLPTLGSLVRLKGKGDALFTVIEIKIGKFKVAPLGGDKGRFYRNVVPAHLTVVDPADVLK